jgi:UDP-glucose:(heptosyl)LPS alpha-1,3-glucosyltransferase
MNLALLTRRFDPQGGGTERDLIVTAQSLREAGHQVTIFSHEVRGHSTDFKVRRVGGAALGRTLGLLSFAYAAPRAARRDGAELVISFARTIDADVLRSGGAAHISYVRAARQWRSELQWRAMMLSPYHRAQIFIERHGFKSPQLKLAIAVSNLVRDDLMREFGLTENKVVTLYNGVDLERFRPSRDDSERRHLHESLSVESQAPIVAFVGNGFGRKGLRFLIGAWPKVEHGAHLIVVGADRARQWYQREAAKLRVSDRIHFVGPVPDVARIFQGADALALPSLFEPFGNVVMEAMASGLPVLTSVFCGVAELVPPSMRGFIVADPTDPGEIALRLGALLDAPRSLASEARATAEKFTWSRYGEELIALVDSLAK